MASVQRGMTMALNPIFDSTLAGNDPIANARPHAVPFSTAGPLLLCGLAVSAVISGEFAGWNPGLLQGGFGGMLIATLLITLMYGCLTLTLAELSAAMPFTGGAYAYSRAAFGTWGGLLAGVSQILEYVAALATILVAIGIQVSMVTRSAMGTDLYVPLIWLLVASLFAFLNASGTKVFFRTALILAGASLVVLTIFWVNAIPKVETARLLRVPVMMSNSEWLPNGLLGIAWAMPFAIWFYLAIEVVSLAPEDSHNPARNIPKGMIWGFGILVVAALMTLVASAGSPPGTAVIGVADSPLLLGLQALPELARFPYLVILMVMFGTLTSYHSVLYGGARSIFCLARAGYMPKMLAGMSSRQTPYMAIIAASVLALGLAIASLALSGTFYVVGILVNMSVFGALVSYATTFLAFIALRARHKNMVRPFVSPLGVAGAITGLIITLATTALMFTNVTSQYALLLCIIYLVSAATYWIFRRTYIDQNAPEEAFAADLCKQGSTPPSSMSLVPHTQKYGQWS
ncbi:amino acid permease [Phyllobacterium sp. LjRoot231]|uniref:amino acid permease n=1 Tax=Phyllobacterium sp. LjRoot231 TaxID=3342289 RepID=UPI003ECE1B8B